MKRKLCFLAVAVLGASASYAQEWQSHGHSTQTNDATAPVLGALFSTSTNYLEQLLYSVPHKFEQAVTVNIPSPAGELMRFKVWKNNTMSEGLAVQFPNIRSFSGISLDQPNRTLKLEMGALGIFGMVFDGDETFVFNPADNKLENQYLVVYKRDYPRVAPIACEQGLSGDADLVSADPISIEKNSLAQRTSGTTLKTYRIAVAATGEYTTFQGGTTAIALSAIVTTMNRVNGVYEKEFAVTMSLVPNNASIIYTDAGTDPFSNGNPSTMINQSQSTITSVIGSANFDIGHVFGTNSGGLAGLGVVCNSTSKGRGVTGSGAPVGEPFDIDYVAHELGHQFGADHTFSSVTSSCSGNGVVGSAYEPGSGSTIMAYAGICGSTNLQSLSDAYFHARSLEQISTFITSGNGSTCPVSTTLNNTASSVNSVAASYTIPTHTAFELQAPLAQDATADSLLYCWEQWDNALASSATFSTTGSLFRTNFPTTNRWKSFPATHKVLTKDLYSLGQRLPQVARTIKFVLTVRDLYQGYGGHNLTASNTVNVNVVSTGDSFRVNSQSTAGLQYMAGTTQTLSWNPGGTQNAPISADSVQVYLSTDSANTFPTLIGTFANTGTAQVTIPLQTPVSNKAYFKVKGKNSIFYDLNKARFSVVNNPLPIIDLSIQVAQRNCYNEISWKLSETYGISRIVLEKSADGKNFFEISHQNPDKDSKKYQFKDEHLDQNNQWYRLKVVSNNELVLFSEIAKVDNSCSLIHELDVMPNPSNGLFVVKHAEKISRLSVIDVNGRVIFEAEPNNNQYQIDLSAFSSGVYFLEVKMNHGASMKRKLIKQ